jgi:hypothetical protein
VSLSEDITEVNVGPNTAPETFTFSNNLWYNSSNNNWSPVLPTTDVDQIIGNPLFEDAGNENFSIPPNSLAVGAGLTFEAPMTDYNQNLFQQPPSIGAFEGSDAINQTDDEKQGDFIEVFPNPASRKVHVDGDFENVNIQIINHLGQTVQTYPSDDLPLILDISSLPNGLYLVLIERFHYDQLLVKKIVKK